MPPVLHPRSRTTLSLFTSTLVLSFAVVALPHVIPCPVPHRTKVYADGELKGAEGARRRRRRQYSENGSLNSSRIESERECPVPKPSGLIGQILGFKAQEKELNPKVRVEKYRGPLGRESIESKDS
jgi:cytochrome c oxidase assembly factor 2